MDEEIVLGNSLSKEILEKYPNFEKKKVEISSRCLYIIFEKKRKKKAYI